MSLERDMGETAMGESPSGREEISFQVNRVSPGERVLSFSGSLTVHTVGGLLPRLREFWTMENPEGILVDVSGLRKVDTAGALFFRELEGETRRRSLPFAYRGASGRLEGILGMVPPEPEVLPVPPARHPGLVEEVGEGTVAFFRDFVRVTGFVGDLTLAVGFCLVRPRSVRWGDVLHYMRRAGVDGLPIVGLISFLLGLIMAFMSSLQLRQFGANLYVASLVGIAMVKELGPMMTAILVAGRSGSAYAAEIGTMIVHEEVDALRTMGFEPIRFLTVPKVIAAVLVVPLLTLYADFFGVAGGLVVGITGLDLTVHTYLRETMASIGLFDVFSSLAKSLVFAVIIAGIGCQRGFQAGRSAEGVGASTTSAVVAAIFLIIVADSAFAILFHYIG